MDDLLEESMFSHFTLDRVLRIVLGSLVVFGALVTLADTTFAQSQPLTLSDAVRQGIIEVQLNGSGEPFWQESVAYVIKNKRPTPVAIVVPAGLILEPEDDSIQRLVIAKQYTILLCGTAPGTRAPTGTPCANTTVKGKWYAFCINLSRHAPDEDSVYSVGPMATGPLLQVVRQVDQKAAAGRLGAQFAVWRVTDDFTLDAINSPDLQNSELLQIIAPLLSLARPEIDLAQSLLQDSNTGLKFYSGTPPPDLFNPDTLLSPGARTGIPEIDSLKQQVEDTVRGAAILSAVVGGICILSCAGLAGLIVFFAVRKR
jgi:hypothetical protein